MTLPALIFGLIFLVAAMLTIFFPEVALMTPAVPHCSAAWRAALLLLGLVAVPAALVGLGGNPLPAAVTWDGATRRPADPDDGTILVGLVTVVGWIAWLVFAVSVVSELVALLSRRADPDPAAGPGRPAAGGGRAARSR